MDTNNSITGAAQVDTAVQANQVGQVNTAPQNVTGPQFNGTNMSVQYLAQPNTNGGDIVMNVNNQR